MSRGQKDTGVPSGCLSADDCKILLERVKRFSSGGGDISIGIRSRWTGYVRWARNEIVVSGDTVNHEIGVRRVLRGNYANATTNGTDDDSLRTCVERAEARLRVRGEPNDGWWESRRDETYAKPELWSDATVQMTSGLRTAIQQRLTDPVVNAQLLSAGYLQVEAVGNGVVNTQGLFAYLPSTRAQLSTTVRDPKRNGSGWAGSDNMDWQRIDAQKIADTALEKCQQSANPVAIEPGRYTVVLEAQAVADLMYPLVTTFERTAPELLMLGPWRYRHSLTKIGQMVFDERVNISADPADSRIPFVPFTFYGDPYRPVQWVSDGVLQHLEYNRRYALEYMNRTDPLINSKAFVMEGATSSVPEMIAGTKRGLLVTRFVNVHMLDFDSVVCGGTTSDGTWLIENGKMTKAIRNFRIRESPLFMFNNLELLGVPERVFMESPTMVPSAKVRDFCMVGLSDAI